MNQYWHTHQIAPFGAFSDSEIAELIAAQDHALRMDEDPEVWSEDDWKEFERDRARFEQEYTSG